MNRYQVQNLEVPSENSSYINIQSYLFHFHMLHILKPLILKSIRYNNILRVKLIPMSYIGLLYKKTLKLNNLHIYKYKTR